MAVTGFWYVRHAPDEEIESLRPPIDDFVRKVSADNGIQEVLAAWKAWPARVHGFGPDRSLDRLNRLFLGAFLAATPGENAFFACSRDDIDDVTWDVGRQNPPDRVEALFAHIDRFPPISSLFMGIGPERASWLPGALGCFALTAAELDAQANHMRRAHVLNPAERTDAVHRMTTWLEIGTPAGFRPSQVLEALPAVIGPALAKGVGLVSVTAAL